MSEELGDFAKAKRAALVDTKSDAATPFDALDLARDYIEDNPEAERVVVVVERPEGGVMLFSAQSTYATSVFMLESAKLMLVSAVG